MDKQFKKDLEEILDKRFALQENKFDKNLDKLKFELLTGFDRKFDDLQKQIDGLAINTKEGIEDILRKILNFKDDFKDLSNRFEIQENRLDQFEKNFNSNEFTISSVYSRFAEVKNRLASLERKFDLATKTQNQRIGAHDKRLKKLENLPAVA